MITVEAIQEKINEETAKARERGVMIGIEACLHVMLKYQDKLTEINQHADLFVLKDAISLLEGLKKSRIK